MIRDTLAALLVAALIGGPMFYYFLWVMKP
jgi:ABC-type Fe3+-siderophore transport system permease subunit